MSFKTCPHCGMRLTDSRYIEEEEDLEDRIIMLLQHESPEYPEDALAGILTETDVLRRRFDIFQARPN